MGTQHDARPQEMVTGSTAADSFVYLEGAWFKIGKFHHNL